MACYDALVIVIELLHDRIHGHQYPFLFGTLPLMKSLHEKFCLLEESLQDYSSNDDETADHVEAWIRDVAYRAQDIIEFETFESKNVLVRAFDWLTDNQDSRLKMVKKEIDSILEKLEAIKETQMIKNLQLNNDSATIGTSEQSCTSIGTNIMVGFGEYMSKIKDQLCGHSSQLQLISIVGTGGIGKTTLARNAFDDALVIHRFDHRAWAAVSQDYGVNNVLQSLLTSMGMNFDELRGKEETELKEKLYKFLKGKRYIAVLDDVWSVQVWDDLKFVFPDDRQGSRVMLTTRIMDIADQCVGTSDSVHEIQFLNAEESWTLFQEKVFGQNCCPLDLENIGRSIVSKCYGLPLAIVVIGGILSNAKQLHNWEEISRNMSTILNGHDGHLPQIFSLSYNQLSHQQKACFLYMASFPEDYQISVSNLIMLWIAEGFLKSTNESKSLEKMGEECLEDLVKRSLALATKKSDTGKFKLCVLHDLLRDFCRHKAHRQGFFGNNVYSYPRSGEMCVDSMQTFEAQQNKEYLYRLERHEHKLLRVLGYHDVLFSDPIPDAIYEMIQMKYLRWNVWACTLTYNGTLHIPPSISALQNLQSLIIENVWKCKLWKCIVYLPLEIWKLRKLRHVVICGVWLPPIPMVSDTCVLKLEYLQTLMTLHGFRFTHEAIEMIPNLTKLKTYYSYSGLGSDCAHHNLLEFYGLNNLVNLCKLEELKISFYCTWPHIDFPCGFNFPINLTKLSLTGSGFDQDCMTVAGFLPNLQVLKLEFIHGDKWEPKVGGFLSLKVLKMKGVEFFMYWQAESCHFPCLEYLCISNCYSLKIPLEIGDIPTLKVIEVCKSAKAQESALKIQEEQESLGNDMLQVRIVAANAS